MKVLLVEDNDETASFVTRGLLESGAVVERCTNANDALRTAADPNLDVIIFDRMLPGMDGLDAIRLLRASHVATPILVLSARSGIDDRVDGFAGGADDYLVKPFAFEELLARVKALMRRPPLTSDVTALQISDLHLDRLTRRVKRGDAALDLSPHEFKILDYLMQNEGQVVTRTMLLERIWGYRFDPKTTLVQTHMSRLRAKVDKGFPHELIKTVRGAGYVISAP
ncbi:MAG: response regulator transcription factor [Pseudomonadota bacterium]